jgi:hypothetical protein
VSGGQQQGEGASQAEAATERTSRDISR